MINGTPQHKLNFKHGSHSCDNNIMVTRNHHMHVHSANSQCRKLETKFWFYDSRATLLLLMIRNIAQEYTKMNRMATYISNQVHSTLHISYLVFFLHKIACLQEWWISHSSLHQLWTATRYLLQNSRYARVWSIWITCWCVWVQIRSNVNVVSPAWISLSTQQKRVGWSDLSVVGYQCVICIGVCKINTLALLRMLF